MVHYVDKVGLCHSVAILLEIYVMWRHNFHFQAYYETACRVVGAYPPSMSLPLLDILSKALRYLISIVTYS